MSHNQPYPLWHPVYWLTTWGYCGLAPKAPGTVGTLLALPYGWLIHKYAGHKGLLIASILCFFIGWWVSELYVRKTGRQDPKEVVIDEVAGMWLVLAVIGYHLPLTIGFIILAFIMFRLFDVAKPWPVSLADEHIKGGLGIMLDDILASVYSLLSIAIAFMLYLVVMS